MNTKKQLLPCEQGQYASHRVSRGLSNTHLNLFHIDDPKNNNDKVINNGNKSTSLNLNLSNSRSRSIPRIKYIHKIELKDKIDHVNHLISYHYGPKFKDDCITDKPNRSNYRNIVNKTKESFNNEDYVLQVY